MTAPTTLPALPGVPAVPGPTGPAAPGPGSGSPAFADALDDALGSGGTPAGQQAGTAAEEKTSDDPASGQDGAVVPAVILPPGLWVLLSAASAPSAPAGTAPTAAPDAIAPPAGAPVALPAAAPSAEPAAVDTVAPAAVSTAAAPAAPVPATTAVADAVAPELPQLVVISPSGTTAPLQAAAVVPPGAPVPSVPAGPPPASAHPGTSGPAVLPLPAPTAAPSGDSPDTAADDRSKDSAGGPAPARPASDADPVAVFGTTALPAPAGAALDAAATPPPAALDEPVAAQLGRQLAVLTEAPDGTQTMTLVITPDDLGPVSIQATITDGTLDLTLHGAHEHGRHALTEALPDLRRELETAGLSLRRLEVGADSGGDAAGWQRAAQQQLPDPRGGSPGRPGSAPADGRSRLRDDDQHGAGTPVRTADLSTSRGVDVRV